LNLKFSALHNICYSGDKEQSVERTVVF